MKPIEDRPLLDEIAAACRRATDWVLAQQRPSGVIGDPAFGFKYYRGPWALALMGETESAHALCDWVTTHLLRDGRLDGEARRLIDGWAYRDSALIIGAHMVGRYDLSHGLVPSLLSWQDALSGGFANDALPGGGGSDVMDVPYAAGPGLALIATGRLAEARHVAAFLARVYSAQHALPDRLYFCWSREAQRPLVETDPGFEQRFVVDQHADRQQRWTVGGIAAAFLGALYLAEPRPEFLELARTYQSFSMSATPAQFGYPSVCKSSWGASALYAITAEHVYLEWLRRMAAWYLDRQESEGWWHPWVEASVADVIEITLEFIMHLKILCGAVVSRSSGV